MPAGTRHKTLVFLAFMLLTLGLVGCGDTPEPGPDTAPVTEVAQANTEATMEARIKILEA